MACQIHGYSLQESKPQTWCQYLLHDSMLFWVKVRKREVGCVSRIRRKFKRRWGGTEEWEKNLKQKCQKDYHGLGLGQTQIHSVSAACQFLNLRLLLNISNIQLECRLQSLS